MIAYLKKIWGPEIKKTWINYCLFNTSGKPTKFFADDRFGETIIKENKEKVKPLANATLDKFLIEVVVLNIISLAKAREIMVRKNDATKYDCNAKVT